eukprot:GEMP01036737.1.p1 GENE.GEMP01036737.1~~GEMP01036737.1.p1  ORF type:complete len:334 (+),score=56.90 GEMP01036737.1:370-1371(+)
MKILNIWLLGTVVAYKSQLRSSTTGAIGTLTTDANTSQKAGCAVSHCIICPDSGDTCTECNTGFLLYKLPTRCEDAEGISCGNDINCPSPLYCRGDPNITGSHNCQLSSNTSNCKCQHKVSCGPNQVKANTCGDCFACGGDCKWEENAASGKGECLERTMAESRNAKATSGSRSSNGRLWIGIISAILIFLVILAIILFIGLKKRRRHEARETLVEQKGVEQQTQKRPVSVALVHSAPKAPPRETLASLYPEADHLTMVTRENAAQGLKVVRGRHWDFVDQDGGQGAVGQIMFCVKAPNWWMVEWPTTASHAYYCGEDADDRCDLAVAEEEEL